MLFERIVETTRDRCGWDRIDQDRFGQYRSEKAKTSQDRSGKVRTGQVRTYAQILCLLLNLNRNVTTIQKQF